ncbi:hypothetical protein AAOE16_18230 [Ekhidna sp. MALMAid0563]|uniref:hypothetical protein n=1 Tax=Ekhidna sp. MALMAid0563 TaxID=3143937 RepID=UPI0032DEBA40
MESFKQIRNHLHQLEWSDLLSYVPTLCFEDLPNNDKQAKGKVLHLSHTKLIIGYDTDSKLRVFSSSDLRFLTKDEFVAYLLEDLTLTSFEELSELSVYATPSLDDDVLFDPEDPLGSLLEIELLEDSGGRVYRTIFGDTLPLTYEKKTRNFIFFHDFSYWIFNARPGIHYTEAFAKQKKILVHFDPRHALLNDPEEYGHITVPMKDLRSFKYLSEILNKSETPFAFNINTVSDYSHLISYALSTHPQKNARLRLTSFYMENSIGRCTIDFKEDLTGIKKRAVASELGQRAKKYMTMPKDSKEYLEQSFVIDPELFQDFSQFYSVELNNDQLLIEGRFTKSYAKMLLDLFFEPFDIERVGDLLPTVAT